MYRGALAAPAAVTFDSLRGAMTDIHWLNPINGTFSYAQNWRGGVVPGAGDDAILDAAGTTPYTVKCLASATVNSIQTAADATLDIAIGPLMAVNGTGGGVNAGAIDIGNAAKFGIGGVVDNTGVIDLQGEGAETFLEIAATGATLTGGGQVIMSAGGDNLIAPPMTNVQSTLVNVDNTISGAGLIGADTTSNSLVFVNEAQGVINANSARGIFLGAVTNAGLIEATGAGTLELSGAVENTGLIRNIGRGAITLYDGTINDTPGGTFDPGKSLVLKDGVVVGGSFSTAAGAAITVASGYRNSLYVDSFTNAGNVVIRDGASLDLQDAVKNSGVIEVNGGSLLGGKEEHRLTLTGGGIVTLSNTLYSQILAYAVTNVDNTLSGSGLIHGQLTNLAKGVIDADGTKALVIQGLLSNRGLVESTGAGGFRIFDGTLTNFGTVMDAGPGAISIAGATLDDSKGGTLAMGASLVLDEGVVLGGNLTTAVGQAITVQSYGRIATASLINHGAITVEDAASLALQGAVINSGAIAVGGAGGDSTLKIGAANVTLSGGGTVTLGDGAANVIYGAVKGEQTLTNVDNTISGTGFIGVDHRSEGVGLILVNGSAGVIAANGHGLTLDTGTYAIANAGLIEAEGAGVANLASAVSNAGTLLADGGTLIAEGAVSGAGMAAVDGGRLRFEGSFNEAVTFLGAPGVLELAHSVSFTANIAGFATSGASALDLDDIVFTSGVTKASFADNGMHTGGVLTVTDGTHTSHVSLTGDFTGLVFTAVSDGHGGTAVSDITAMHWPNAVNGSFQTGADWSGGVVPTVRNDAVLDAPGQTAYTVTVSAVQSVHGIQTSAKATLLVSGTFMAAGGTDGGASAGVIVVGSGGTFTAGGTLDNTGSIRLAGAASVATLLAQGTLTLTGGGDLFLNAVGRNVIEGVDAAARLVNVDDRVFGAGLLGDGQLTLTNGAAGAIEASSAAPLVLDTGAQAIDNAGLIAATGDGGLIIASAVVNTGTLAATAGRLTAEGAVSGAGEVRIAAGTADFQSAFGQNVVFASGSRGTLELARSLAYRGTISGFSKAGATALDLDGIAFGAKTAASYKGAASGGTLTVVDGTHTAHIEFSGNYTASTFTVASDGHGGTKVVASSADAPAPLPQRFVAAMAGIGAPAGGLIPHSHPPGSRAAMLARPHVVIA